MDISKRQTKPPVLFFFLLTLPHIVSQFGWLVPSRPSAHPPPPLFSKDLSPSQDLFRPHTQHQQKKKSASRFRFATTLLTTLRFD